MLGDAFGCAALILHDVLVGGYRQHTRIMEAVWPVTALYCGPLALFNVLPPGAPAEPEVVREARR